MKYFKFFTKLENVCDMLYFSIFLLTACKVTAADDSATFLQLSLGLTAASPTSIRPWPEALYKLNADKTELLWFGSTSQLHQPPSHSSTVHNKLNINQ